MKCKKCKRVLMDNSIFCNWCGAKQIKDDEKLFVPAPKKLKNGKWSGQVMVDGERVRVLGMNEPDYYRKARAVKAGLVEIEPKKPKLTLESAIEKYIEDRSAILSPSSIRGYQTIKRNRFRSVMKKDIHSIDNWQELINEEVKAGAAPKTVSNAWRFISSVLKSSGITPPVCVLPQRKPAERPFLAAEDIPGYIESVKDKKCETAALFALHGLRQSELLALTWNDIDLVSGTISVNGAMVPNEAHRYVSKQETKTESSRRTVPIFIPRLNEILGAVPQEERTGNIITAHPSSIRRQLVDINPDITLHCLRHSFASLAYSLGLSELETMKLGGWSSSQTMRQIYTHLGEGDRTAAVEKISEFFNFT